jgi:hypothetical protein
MKNGVQPQQMQGNAHHEEKEIGKQNAVQSQWSTNRESYV